MPLLLLVGCVDDPVSCFTHELQENGKVVLNSTCSENAEEYKWYLYQEQLSTTQKGPIRTDKPNPTLNLVLPGTHTISLVVVNDYKDDSSYVTITAPEYCVICETYSQCAGFFEAQAKERAGFLNSRDFDSCLVELK